MDFLHQALFGYYPYIALTVFLLGSLLRFDREQYSWRSGSSQLLSKDKLRLGSNLFHIGILGLLAGHSVGLLTPIWVFEALGVSHESKQLLAIVAGSIFGASCVTGMVILLRRRLTTPRIRLTSSRMDIAILALLLAQGILGLVTVPFSWMHRSGETMVLFMTWAQSILTFRPGAADVIRDVGFVFKIHVFLGLTIVLLFPFSRLVHLWSAPIGYVGRCYQVVRTRKVG
ncbi:nitrate reductase A subunit gamma [Azospirillaceae bacterium]